MSKGQQGPKGKQDLEDYIERQAKKGGCICFEYAFSRGGSGDGRSQYICAAKHIYEYAFSRGGAGMEEANIYALQSM